MNSVVNFGWEYVYHCHILSHEEMDMMRPIVVALPPIKADTLAATVNPSGASAFVVRLTWNDNSINETAFVVQRSTDGIAWTDVGTVQQPLRRQSLPSGHGGQQADDSTVQQDRVYQYRIVAENKVGYLGAGGAFMSQTVKSFSAPVTVTVPVANPTTLTATYQAGTGSTTWLPPRVLLSWTDNSAVETGFNIERSTDNGTTWTPIATPATKPANAGPTATFTDTGPLEQLSPNTTYTYRVAAVGAITGPSAWSNLASATTPAFPPFTTILTIAGSRVGNSPNDRVTLTWTNVANPNETGYTVQRATNANFTLGLVSNNVGANVTTFTTGNVRSEHDVLLPSQTVQRGRPIGLVARQQRVDTVARHSLAPPSGRRKPLQQEGGGPRSLPLPRSSDRRPYLVLKVPTCPWRTKSRGGPPRRAGDDLGGQAVR